MISRNILQDEAQLLDWKQQLDRDVETLKAKSNICNIRSVSCNCLPFLKLEMLCFLSDIYMQAFQIIHILHIST